MTPMKPRLGGGGGGGLLHYLDCGRKSQNWKLEMFTLEELSLVKRNVHIGSQK